MIVIYSRSETLVLLLQGHYGEVYKGMYRMPNGEEVPVAVKCLKRYDITDQFSDKNAKLNREMEREIDAMARLSHPHVVDIFGSTQKRAHADLQLSSAKLFVKRVARCMIGCFR